MTSQTSTASYIPLLRRGVSEAFKGTSLRERWLKARMFAAGIRHREALTRIRNAPQDSALRMALDARAQMLGLLIWPYQCASWDTDKRLERFQAHYAEIDRIGAPLKFGLDEKLVLANLDAQYPGLRVVLYQPLWLMREGGLTISLFNEDTLIFALTFSLYSDADGDRCALIGGCQGRNVDGILDVYRDLTKALHGLRPRDFLMECFGILCRIIDVRHAYAVSDRERHRRHPFFNQTGDFPQDYDIPWQERGGVLEPNGLYKFPQDPVRKTLDEIKPKKRSLYRKRFAFLDELEPRIAEEFPTLKPIKFKDL
ncbi:DUF535 family protein [Roseovarius sp. CAU 1744]|uniref:DUF535 family protein n=1 Tax=Roseovarius sp. CAU 1744 TaxID=3140368 RepID=UPI00325B5CB1